jgi:hypothetical protein
VSPFSEGLDPVFALLARLGLGGLLLSAAIHKGRDLARFVDTVRDYRILPERLSTFGAWALALGEAAVALSLLVPRLDPMGPLGAIALLGLYTAAIGFNLMRGRRHIDCGCAGFGLRRQTLNGWLPIRNTLLLGWVDFLSIGAGLAIGALLWLSAHELARARTIASALEETP